MLLTNLILGILNAGDKPLLQVTNFTLGIINAGDKPLTRYH